MATLIRWNPMIEIPSLRERMSRIFTSTVARTPFEEEEEEARGEWTPPVDICEKEGSLVVKIDLPGMCREEIQVVVQRDALTVRGEKRESREGAFYRLERSSGSFDRSLTLPEPVQTERMESRMENGVLEIVLPKAERQTG